MREWSLFCGNRFTGVTVRPDARYSTIYRIHASDRSPSDMVNLTRAKDAALTWAATGRGSDRHYWKAAERRVGAPPVQKSPCRVLEPVNAAPP
jgi:hypothetical protein